MPALTWMFFQGAIVVANVDFLQCEDTYDKYLTFQPTLPITSKFESFGVDNKNFMLNSGSYLVMQLLIVAEYCSRKAVNYICVRCARSKCARVVGYYAY